MAEVELEFENPPPSTLDPEAYERVKRKIASKKNRVGVGLSGVTEEVTATYSLTGNQAPPPKEDIRITTPTKTAVNNPVITNDTQQIQTYNMISAEPKQKNIVRRTISNLDRYIDKQSQEIQKNKDTAKASLTAGAVYAGSRFVRGVIGGAEFVIKSPVYAYELSPATNVVRGGYEIFKYGEPEARQRDLARKLLIVSSAKEGLKAIGQDPIGAGFEIAGAGAFFKGFNFAVSGVSQRLATSTPKDNVINLKYNSVRGSYTTSSAKESFIDFNKRLFSDKTGRIGTRSRSTSAGRGTKIRDPRGATLEVNGKRIRSYKQNFVKMDSKAPEQFKEGAIYQDGQEIKTFNTYFREIGRASPQAYKGYGIKISRVPVKPKISSIKDLNTNLGLVQKNVQEKLSYVSNNPLRYRPDNLPPKYTLRVLESNKIRSSVEQGNALVTINKQSPVHIIDDTKGFQSAEVPKVSTDRKLLYVNRDLTVQSSATIKRLFEKYKPSVQQSIPQSPPMAINQAQATKQTASSVSTVGGFSPLALADFRRKLSLSSMPSLYPTLESPSIIIEESYKNPSAINQLSNERTGSIFKEDVRPRLQERITEPLIKPVLDSKLKTYNELKPSLSSVLKIKPMQELVLEKAKVLDKDSSSQQQEKALISDIFINEQNLKLTGEEKLLSQSPFFDTAEKPQILPRATTTPRPPLPRINRIPPEQPFKPIVPKIIFPKPKREDSNSLFIAQVRKQGVFQTVGIGSYQRVLDKAVTLIDRTPLASLRIMRQGSNELLGLGEYSSRFRPSKNNKGVYVEKNLYRINTGGEFSGITNKGIFARRKTK